MKFFTAAHLVVSLLLCATAVVAQPAFNATTMDTPIDEVASFTGNYQVATGGASLYPNLTSASFTANVPACSGGSPTIVAAYLTWFHRVGAVAAGTGEFADQVDLAINGATTSTLTFSNKYDVSFPFDGQFAEYYHVSADVTTLLQTNLTAGTNTFDISDVNTPTNGTSLNDNYGTAITIIYECPEYDNVKVSYFAGNDFFWQDSPVGMGEYSSSYCFTFDAEATARTLDLNAYVGGQANATAPFRGGNYSYMTGTGTAPAMDGGPTVPTGTIWNATNATPNPTWVSDPGQEWDVFNNTINIPANDTWICLQARSFQGGTSTASGSLNNVAFTFSLPVAAAACPTDAGLDDIFCTTGNAILFDLDPMGAGLTGDYNVTVSGGGATSITPTTATYGTATEFTLNTGTAGGGDVTVTITDAVDGTCTIDVIVTDPGACFLPNGDADCTMTDFVYVAEPGNDRVLKFRVDPANGALSSFQDPATAVWATGINDAHGVGLDANGFIYVGKRFPGNVGANRINQYTCDGTLLQADIFQGEFTTDLNNFVIDGRDFYSNIGINHFNLCTEMRVGGSTTGISGYTPNTSIGENYTWELSEGPDGAYYSVANLDGAVRIFRFPADNALIDAGTVFEPFITTDITVPGILPLGLTFDNSGFIYVSARRADGNGGSGNNTSSIFKLDMTGTVVDQLDQFMDNPGTSNNGFFQVWGLRYSSASDRLYVSSEDDACIAVINPNTMMSEPFFIGGGNGKAINIVTEACPNFSSMRIDQTVCGTAGTRISLSDLLPCEGLCATPTSWTRTEGTGGTFEDCDLSFTLDAMTTSSCFNFSGGGGECSAYEIEICFDIVNLTDPVISADQSTCNTIAPQPLMVTTPATGITGITYQWQQSTAIDCGGFIDIPGATGTTYDPGELTETTYFRVVASSDDGVACEAFSNCLTVTIVPDCPACPAPPSVVITEATLPACGTNAVTFNYTVENGPTTIFSSNGGGTLAPAQLSDGTATFTYTPVAADVGNTVTITATIEDPDGADICMASTDMATVTVVATPSATPATMDATCTGATLNADAEINLMAITGDVVGISSAGAGSYDGSAYDAAATADDLELVSGTMTADFTSLAAATTYWVRVFNGSDGCFIDYEVTTNAVSCACPAPPSVVITEATLPACGTNAVTFNYTVENGPTTIFSSDGGGTLAPAQLPNSTATFTYTPVAGDVGNTVTITATIEDPDGAGSCMASTDMATVTVVATPAATPATTDATCTGATLNTDAEINLTAITGDVVGISSAGAGSYDGPAYDATAAAADLELVSGAMTADFTGLAAATTYWVRVFNGSNGCFTDYEVMTNAVMCQTYSLGSTVFEDGNNNGMQDGTEMGIDDVTVQLFDDNNNEILVGPDGILGTADDATGGVMTSGGGNYFFQMLPPGDYVVQIPAGAFAAGMPLEVIAISSTITDTADNEEDNDDNGIQPGGGGMVTTSPVITLGEADGEPTNESGQGGDQDDTDDAAGDMTVDFGFFAPVSVGDTAFVDLNEDGLQSMDEPGVQNVTVTIYDNATGMVVAFDAEGNDYNPETTTDADGSYLFENLPPGEYYVIFDISTVNDAELYTFTTNDVDGDVSDDDDSDANPANGQTPATVFLLSGEENLSLDVGITCNVSVTVSDPASICSTQTIDLVQGASITPAAIGGTWSSSGNGTFNGGTDFATATTYTPSPDDVRLGFVTLTLTTNDPNGPCGPEEASVSFAILAVDCGSFPWGGED